MALLDDIKVRLRLTGEDFDSEVEALISAAKADMLRVGVKDDLVDSDVPLVTEAVSCYCKAHFGFDNGEDADRFARSYRQIVVDLVNSSANEAAGEDS